MHQSSNLCLSPEQQLLLRELLAEKASTILQFTFHEENLQDTIRQHAYLKGQFDLLQTLLQPQDESSES